MSVAAERQRAVTITTFASALGADVTGIDLNQPLSTAQIAELKAAWSRHLVLRFRGQTTLSLASHVGFSRYFGSLDKRPTASFDMSSEYEAMPSEITVISNIRAGGKPLGALGDGEAVWHADMTYNERPPIGACLYAKEIPPAGGNTHFANLYMAYEELDAALRKEVEGLRCVHDASRNSAGELRLGFQDNDDPRKTVGAVHPIVAVHPETGRRYLLLGRRRNAYIPGLPLSDSESLLDALWAHATQPKFTWTQVWSIGDLVMWDNRSTLHRRDAFDPASRRLMYRTQIARDA